MNTDQNIKHKVITFKKKIDNLHDLELGKEFLDMTPKPKSVKEKVDKLDSINFKKLLFCERYY